LTILIQFIDEFLGSVKISVGDEYFDARVGLAALVQHADGSCGLLVLDQHLSHGSADATGAAGQICVFL
jgi:hypothetical protein